MLVTFLRQCCLKPVGDFYKGNGLAIVAQQFDMRPNPTTGLISGAIYGSEQILCGNVNSTQWLVTEYKASNQPGRQCH